MLLRTFLVALLLASSIGVARASTVAEAFDAEMRAWMAAHGVVRGSLGVMRDGRLVHVAGFGDRDADARAGIWSLSKAITATCVSTLVRDKLLSFDSPIGPLLSATFERHGAPIDPRLERVTVRHLISHRSGIPSRVGGNRFAPGTAALLRMHEPHAATVHQLLPEILKLRLTHEPGAQFQYSNVGYLLLGRIVEQATGKSYAHACAERVLRPSGIAGAGLHTKWGSLLDASAGWELSAAEFLAFARQLRPGRQSILDAATHALLVEPDGFWRDHRKKTAYTLGVIVWPGANPLPGLSHTGGWNWAQQDARGDQASGVRRHREQCATGDGKQQQAGHRTTRADPIHQHAARNLNERGGEQHDAGQSAQHLRTDRQLAREDRRHHDVRAAQKLHRHADQDEHGVHQDGGARYG